MMEDILPWLHVFLSEVPGFFLRFRMTKYNTSRTEHGFTTNFRKSHVPIFFFRQSHVYGLKEMKIAKCFSTVHVSRTATFRRELGGEYSSKCHGARHVFCIKFPFVGLPRGDALK